jgi:DNA-binding NarL/FixJ family response regulator
MIRVLVVDDHEVVRAGLLLLLGRFPDVACVGEAADGEQAVAMVAEHTPDVVLMDLSMPTMDGVTATRLIVERHPEIRVVVLTTFTDRDHVTAAIDAGAVGFLLKDSDPSALHEGIRAAHRGEAPLDPRAAMALVSNRRAATPGLDALTQREREVLSLIGRGLSNRLIAKELGIAEKTVKAHLTKVFTTIGVTDRTQAALWWERNHVDERRSR